ncbi:transcription termination factor 3, mitochondrial-like [Clavelina lepadiformis]|uniref:transcription termination factor 3, mitochondrial-like n=1 Tax=Clavelina lepadiformis TaxID=159417 RepID=UPI0040415F45
MYFCSKWLLYNPNSWCQKYYTSFLHKKFVAIGNISPLVQVTLYHSEACRRKHGFKNATMRYFTGTTSNFLLDREKIKSFVEFDKKLSQEMENYDPPLTPLNSRNFADFVNSSELLQTLVMFGVNLSMLQHSHPASIQFLVKLDMERDLLPKLNFLKSLGIVAKEFGTILTKNILILNPTKVVDDLKNVVSYLKSKQFSSEQIASVLVRYPQILNFEVPMLDAVLGFYQRVPTNYENRPIHYRGDEVRTIITKCPQLTGASTEAIFLQIKMLEISCGFNISQIRQLILSRPKVLLAEQKSIEMLYKLYIKEMLLTHDQLAKNAFVFDTRLKVVEPRHFYLKSMKRNIYQENQPGYLPLYDIICSTDQEFCEKCQLGPNSDYEKFLKTQ